MHYLPLLSYTHLDWGDPRGVKQSELLIKQYFTVITDSDATSAFPY
ncbi:MAG: hypothetical protein ACFFB0_08360 [Promethearchaeota archaeon]